MISDDEEWRWDTSGKFMTKHHDRKLTDCKQMRMNAYVCIRVQRYIANVLKSPRYISNDNRQDDAI